MSEATKVPAGSSTPDFSAAEDPFALFHAWMAEAEKSEVNDPNAMSVATVDQSGLPNVRTLLLKGVDDASSAERGFVFYTNFESAKGQELLATPKAALLFHWKSLERQVRIRGAVSLASHEEADAYYATRPVLSRIGAWASQQSRPLSSRDVFEAKIQHYEQKFADGVIPRPAYWSGFRVVPSEIEFWAARPFRLHDRIVFRRDAPHDSWHKTRLYP
ncbi:pyridoxamine 5'-phosphate oxidase [Hyphomicrobium denitrificans ATCC 51888]|uniref:Pyridoxine/pyridoxamine 5'-phosphate oxidase n=1 Tax=Hyphomicrobium denitrificans (strain ATCC 51888 / DSM 1869 / NCIMB 11706 / TK 0415) TaxID=582899 RepID=D8JZ93_HYPDA|nr:pyridoxamine 5'-phosphate oxidase [Hyphomicrobium denitrificans]ADJ23695.1 pyridoxamine 5'-phosphate oxidase [Hyphomicrobium denitrificans ATCC 51888]